MKSKYAYLFVGVALASPMVFMLAELWIAFWMSSDIKSLGYDGWRGAFPFVVAPIAIICFASYWSSKDE